MSQADARAACKAVDKAEHKVYDVTGRTHGRQCAYVQRFADDDRVGQRVEQLEQVAQYDRDRKPQQRTKGTADGEIHLF